MKLFATRVGETSAPWCIKGTTSNKQPPRTKAQTVFTLGIWLVTSRVSFILRQHLENTSITSHSFCSHVFIQQYAGRLAGTSSGPAAEGAEGSKQHPGRKASREAHAVSMWCEHTRGRNRLWLAGEVSKVFKSIKFSDIHSFRNYWAPFTATVLSYCEYK